jgi:FlaA1/EpsC-like NDP-sugar epimerase
MNRIRNRYLLLSDAALLTASPFLLYSLRFEGWHWGPAHSRAAVLFTLIVVPLHLATIYAYRLYQRLWRYASIAELRSIVFVTLTAAPLAFTIGAVLLPGTGLTATRVPLSVLFTYTILSLGIIGTPRLLTRMGSLRGLDVRTRAGDRRVLIVGAGAAGQMIVKELRQNPALEMKPVGLLDDDESKHGLHLADVEVVGSLADLTDVARRLEAEEVIIAMPAAPGVVLRRVIQAALEAGVRTRIVPGLSDIISGQVNVSALREVQIEDLLRREPIRTNVRQVATLATGRTVMVTGAGGSIGSELCRQLIALNPERLVILGHGENPIFGILNELRSIAPRLDVVPIIADVRNAPRIHAVMHEYGPHAVFHAAAHKHVPLMEGNVIEAVSNNVCGTRNIIDAAITTGVHHFVLISTDKAVRPTNVMGATKRVAEHIVRHAAHAYQRNFVAVRFGNVLGSQGSVVPIFSQQIKDGGPVTVTHPEMRRYFMTIPEAVQLVLQAGALGRGGELFMLDMGEPIRIVDLARDMIRLSGLEEGTDIQIKFTGVRPGEKLYEEMFFSDEHAERTSHPKVLRAMNGESTRLEMVAIEELIAAAESHSDDGVLRELLSRAVPGFSSRDWVAPREVLHLDTSLPAPLDHLQRMPPPHSRTAAKQSRSQGSAHRAQM